MLMLTAQDTTLKTTDLAFEDFQCFLRTQLICIWKFSYRTSNVEPETSIS